MLDLTIHTLRARDGVKTPTHHDIKKTKVLTLGQIVVAGEGLEPPTRGL